DDIHRPDYVHFDLDPGPGATFEQVRDSALHVREALEALKMKPLVKTSGSKGLHVYVPIVRGPLQKTVWTFAKALAVALASRQPQLMTSEYRKEKRPNGARSPAARASRTSAWTTCASGLRRQATSGSRCSCPGDAPTWANSYSFANGCSTSAQDRRLFVHRRNTLSKDATPPARLGRVSAPNRHTHSHAARGTPDRRPRKMLTQ